MDITLPCFRKLIYLICEININSVCRLSCFYLCGLFLMSNVDFINLSKMEILSNQVFYVFLIVVWKKHKVVLQLLFDNHFHVYVTVIIFLRIYYDFKLLYSDYNLFYTPIHDWEYNIVILYGYYISSNPANIYLFKLNSRNTRKRCEICLKLTIFHTFL